MGDDDGYDTNGEIDIEITEGENICVYSIPYKPTHCNRKRLICFSIINNEKCIYDTNCTYAHSLSEQVIDVEKKFVYQVILDKNLMNFSFLYDTKIDEIYKQLLFLTHVCDNCLEKKCTGGYNCRNGATDAVLKICKNDLLMGECLNKMVDVVVDGTTLDKLQAPNFEQCDKYKGCINGHHLTQRGLVPYYKYLGQCENSGKNGYQTFRFVDIDPFDISLRCSKKWSECCDDVSESTTDEEVNDWFQNDFDK